MGFWAKSRVASAVFTLMLLYGNRAGAQVTPAAGYTPPDDTPRIGVGMTLWPSFTLQTEPNITDAAGNSVNRSSFDVGRAYINVTGQLSHIIAFRITPDITRESGLLSLAPGSTVPNDSLVFRIKYAYAQFNLEWAGAGSCRAPPASARVSSAHRSRRRSGQRRDDEVKDRLHDSALALSGGQQQRLCIARALAIRPEILLLDEPASALDPIATQRIEELIYDLKKTYTIVIVTHNMQQAARVSDCTAFFWLGRLVEYDRTDRMFTAPAEKLTEDYVTGRCG